ncbi:FAD:protein FMN transferase [Psychroflexus aestuariivivens]|uniref:FAD:protein FMN transferase n=1 Tax=Psychroflexus aestuariivivens TaxID=1795040 RepID=UPI000FDA1EDB|nr:FAD:protein FMN transferase [Psychroflexus aestuariivivens]
MKYILPILIFFLISCQEENNEYKVLQGNAFGTTYGIQFFSDAKAINEKSIDSIFDKLNQSMSTYITYSDISKINSGYENIKVDDAFLEVFNSAKKIYNESEGYFDPTVGLLVNAYGFGPEGYDENFTKTELDSLMTYVGFDKLRIQNRQVLSTKPHFYIDFNAIAKGYAVDRVAIFLEQNGIENYLVEIGGEVRVKGKNKRTDQLWKLGIDMPTENDERILKYATELSNEALATSGNYRKFRIDSATGNKFVHTINPKTGLAKKSNILSASIIAKTCMEADAYATACMAMGFSKAKIMVESLEEIDAFFIYINDEGEQKTFSTKGFQEKLIEL